MKKILHKVKAKVKAAVKSALKTAPPPEAPPVPVNIPDRAPFYAHVRQTMGSLTDSQVAGFEKIFEHFFSSTIIQTVPKWKEYLAYMFATPWHETGTTMQPIEEIGKGKGRAYGKPDKRTGLVYYGRGLVQLTWFDNYKLYGIEKDPNKAKDPDMAAHILIDGMVKGRFTGKKLADYFNAKSNDPVSARRIINGVDQAVKIARYHKIFLAAIAELEKPGVVIG